MKPSEAALGRDPGQSEKGGAAAKATRQAIYSTSEAMQARALRLIPGGAHTYAKGEDQFPVPAPGFIVRGQGCHVWDVDGNEFIEYGMGLRAVALGHAYAPVVEAAQRQMLLGSNYARPAAIEVEAAERMLELLDGADMVKFAKNGSDVTTAAVKLARAYTGRELVAVCADHAFFSSDDWFIGTTEQSSGIPAAVSRLSVKFPYGDGDALAKVFDQYPGQIACVIMEAETHTSPKPGYLARVKQLCEERGALWILDEMITGFRWHNGGAQKVHEVVPHLSTFGKAMGNGFAIAALVGKREYMRLGGLDHDRERVFLLSTTHGGETHSLAAAIETMRIYSQEPVIETLYRQGERLRTLVNASIASLGLQGYFEVIGQPCNLVFATRDAERKPSQMFRTLFLQEMIQRGILAPSFVVSYSHGNDDIDRTATAAGEALKVYAQALDGGAERFLRGRPVKPVNRRYN